MHAPNVQIARKIRHALDRRFDATRDAAATESRAPLFEALVQVGLECKPVVAIEVNFGTSLFETARAFYASYAQQVRGGLRAPATDTNDAHRRIVDTLIYDGYGEDICFAALSLDGRGVTSWGSIYLELDPATVAYRSTVLEENAYFFVRNHDLTLQTLPNRVDILAGYLAEWDERHKLVAAKLAPRASALPNPPDFATTLISPGSGRADVDFLEVHIYGTFNYQAVASVRALGAQYTQPINALQFAAFTHLVQQASGRPVEIL